MHIRNGFVSNSSSSSFTIRTCDLNVAQLEMIRAHVKEAEGESWAIIEVGEHVKGSTFMDNFDMRSYLERIGIDMSKVEWGY